MFRFTLFQFILKYRQPLEKKKIDDQSGRLDILSLDSEHMVCTKCGTKSDTEIENKIHYHIQHKTRSN
jgi:hypothetical protein